MHIIHDDVFIGQCVIDYTRFVCDRPDTIMCEVLYTSCMLIEISDRNIRPRFPVGFPMTLVGKYKYGSLSQHKCTKCIYLQA